MQQTVYPLTSLRFVAAFSVYVHHSIAVSPAQRSLGIIGVEFFFILSRMILAHVYQERLALDGWGRYYIARIARILPMHWTTAIMVFVIAMPLMTQNELIRDMLNLSLLQGYIPIPSVYFSLNAPSWSLSAELLFYAAFPFILPTVMRLSWLQAAMLVVVLVTAAVIWATAWRGSLIEHWALYIFPLARLLEFIAGIALWRLMKDVNLSRRAATALELVALCAVAALIGYFGAIPQHLQYTVAAFLPCLATLGVFYRSAGIISAVLSWRPLVYLGEISFAFYMVHLPIINLLAARDMTITFPSALFAAIVLHHSIELPAQRILLRRLQRQ